MEEVRIYDKDMHLKEVLSKETLIKKHWEQSSILHAAKKKVKEAQQVSHVCKDCKKTFVGVKSRVFCQDPCNRIYEKIVRPAKILCRLCKKSFQPIGRKLIFCGSPCDHVMWLRKSRIYKKLKGGGA